MIDNLQQDSPLNFPHYCMLDNDTWIGPEGSLCPICRTNGIVDETAQTYAISGWQDWKDDESKQENIGPTTAKQPKGFFGKILSKIGL